MQGKGKPKKRNLNGTLRKKENLSKQEKEKKGKSSEKKNPFSLPQETSNGKKKKSREKKKTSSLLQSSEKGDRRQTRQKEMISVATGNNKFYTTQGGELPSEKATASQKRKETGRGQEKPSPRTNQKEDQSLEKNHRPQKEHIEGKGKRPQKKNIYFKRGREMQNKGTGEGSPQRKRWSFPRKQRNREKGLSHAFAHQTA